MMATKIINTKVSRQKILVKSNLIKHGNSVFPIHNVASFEFGRFNIGPLLPYGITLIIFVISMIIYSSSEIFNTSSRRGSEVNSIQVLALIIMIGMFAVFIVNLSRLSKSGFRLSINSGESLLFLSTDFSEGKKVVRDLISCLEDPRALVHENYVINISNARISGDFIAHDKNIN